MELIVDVKPIGPESAVVYAPFDKAKEALESKGYKIIDLETNARLRMQEGKNADVSRRDNCVREGALYVPAKGIFLTKKSPIILNPREATQANRNGIDYFLTDEQTEEALTDSVKLSRDSIPTNRFGENEITNYAFGEVAEQYGQFLREAGIKEMPVWLADLQGKPFARQIWFWDLGDRSGLDGYDWYLDNGGRLRGVKMGAEGTVLNLEGYVGFEQVSQVIQRANLSPNEKHRLRNALEFFN